MTMYSSTMDTPIGHFTIITDHDGAVLASGWTDRVDDLLLLIHSSLRGDPMPATDLGTATRAVQAYLDGDLAAPSSVPVRQQASGSYLPIAWKTLRDVAPGEPVTYSELAARTGHPSAVRAAAQACARNAAALFVPCHRVIRTDGSLGGFRWGLAAKRWLLDFEARP